MFSSVLFLQLVLFYGLLAYAQSSLQLGFLPLAVKTPYLHGWDTSGGGQTPVGQWPNFVSNSRILRWAGLIRVDSQPYQWMGNGEWARSTGGINNSTTVTSEITPSKTIFRIEAGPVQFNVTFLSPIEPNDYVRQSMPFCYMYIDGIAANDSQPHTIQVYSDISAEWVSGRDTTQMIWNTTTEMNNMMYHWVTRRNPSLMTEIDGMSEDATAYFFTPKRPGLTWGEGNDTVSRAIFAASGNLTETIDTNFRQAFPNEPVFPFSVDLGTIIPGDQPDPVVWAIGLVRDPLVSYTTNGHVQNRSAYYWSNYTRIEDVMSAFLSDFPDALGRSLDLDNKVFSAASAISPEYVGILSLVTRQIFASMDITIPSAQPGQFNNSDVKIFMKDIGQSRRTNAVEVIYGALSALLFFNPSLARDLLQPLLEFQSSPQYPNPYAAPDLGTSYPFVQDNSTDTHTLGVESCGNMLIMVYAHAAKSGDGAFLSLYYSLLQRWADFLVENSLHPSGFVTGDGLGNPDMSNLALKGILGIYSMAKVNEAVGVSDTTYMDKATEFINEWKQLAIGADDHIQAMYGQTSSWGLMYNLFPAVWLKTGLIEDSILESQARFYGQQDSPDFGLSLDTSRFETVYPHWNLMTAATIPDNLTTIRNGLIKSTFQRAYKPDSPTPLPVVYRSSDGLGLFGTGNGSPILGAAFAVAAMQLQNRDITAPQVSLPSSSHAKDNVSAIVGGVIGGFAFLLLITTATYILWRKHKWQPQYKSSPFTVATRNNANGDMAQVSQQTNVGGQSALGESIFSRPRPPPTMGELLNPNPHLAGVVVSPLSRKQREALGRSRWHISRQSELLLLAPSDPNRGPVSGTDDLRVELEQLRQEVESIRHTGGAPPSYS